MTMEQTRATFGYSNGMQAQKVGSSLVMTLMGRNQKMRVVGALISPQEETFWQLVPPEMMTMVPIQGM